MHFRVLFFFFFQHDHGLLLIDFMILFFLSITKEDINLLLGLLSCLKSSGV